MDGIVTWHKLTACNSNSVAGGSTQIPVGGTWYPSFTQRWYLGTLMEPVMGTCHTWVYRTRVTGTCLAILSPVMENANIQRIKKNVTSHVQSKKCENGNVTTSNPSANGPYTS